MKNLCKIYLLIQSFSLLSGCAYLDGTDPLGKNPNYDWYYGSDINKSFDKFDNITKIEITPIRIHENDDSSTSLSIYHLDKSDAPSPDLRNAAYLVISKSTRFPRLKDDPLKISLNEVIHTFNQHRHTISERVIGSGRRYGNSSSYSSETVYTEAAAYRINASMLCQITESNEFEFKIDTTYKLSKAYSNSIIQWCKEIGEVKTEIPSNARIGL